MSRAICIIIISGIFLASVGCNQAEENDTNIADDPTEKYAEAPEIADFFPLIVAHRGASAAAPENTLPAFNLAWELGADAIEGDFWLTSDGFVVCHHDGTTKRTAGMNRGIEGQTLAELRQLDVGKWKAAKWAGTGIPTLGEVLAGVPDDKSILIEIKSDVQIVPAIIRAIDASGLRGEQITVICFKSAVIAVIKEARPDLKALWLIGFDRVEGGNGWEPTLAEIIETAKRIRADGVDLKANLEVLDKAFVDGLRSAGLEFHAWTVDDPAVAEALMELGVDSITTNRPDYLRTQLESGG